MIVKLLTEHHFEFLSLKGGCTVSTESTCQNVKLLEISCCGSYNIILVKYRAVLLQRLQTWLMLIRFIAPIIMGG